MIQDIAPHRYDNTFAPAAPAQSSPVLCFREGQVLLRRTASGALALPCLEDLPAFSAPPRFAFRLDGTAYFLALAPVDAPTEALYFAPQVSLRQAEPQHLAFACAVAGSLLRWYTGNRFCGACGAENRHSEKERALVCPRCGRVLYPKICPAVIVAITDGNRLLLTKYAGRAYKR